MRAKASRPGQSAHGTGESISIPKLFRRGFAISHHSLAQLVNQLDFSKLRDSLESDRLSFYEALAESIPPGSRGVEDGIQILGEHDSDQIVNAMSGKAMAQGFASSRIRDIWCKLFIGGCP